MTPAPCHHPSPSRNLFRLSGALRGRFQPSLTSFYFLLFLDRTNPSFPPILTSSCILCFVMLRVRCCIRAWFFLLPGWEKDCCMIRGRSPVLLDSSWIRLESWYNFWKSLRISINLMFPFGFFEIREKMGTSEGLNLFSFVIVITMKKQKKKIKLKKMTNEYK